MKTAISNLICIPANFPFAASQSEDFFIHQVKILILNHHLRFCGKDFNL